MTNLNINRLNVNKQSGVALFVSLILLLVLTIIGISAAQRGSLQERIAANVHTENMAFSAAESALGAFLVEAATGESRDDGHVLFEARTTNDIENKYYDNSGNRVESGYLDSDHGGDVFATITPSIFQQCSVGICGGFSLGQSTAGAGVGCRVYQLDSQGNVGKIGDPVQTVSTSLWAYEVTICRQ